MREEVLDTALARGVITAEQALRLRAIAADVEGGAALLNAGPRGPAGPSEDDLPSDSERLRFVTGFADIFVTIGIALFLGGSAYLLEGTAGPATVAGIVAALAWGLAEFFSRVRRMALPSIVLLCAFAGASFLALLAGLANLDGVAVPRGFGLDMRRPELVAAAGLGTAALVAAHYARFRVPITVAAGVTALAASALGLAYAAAPDFARDNLPALLLLAGVAIFALAMRFDLSDPARVTRRTDIAFWLHLVAAPLIVHPLVGPLIAQDGAITQRAALSVVAAVLVFAVVAVVIDRRALLVSGLVYTGFAFGALIRDAGFGADGDTTPAALLALGAFVLLLSAGWRPLRSLFLKLLPARLAARLPHPLMAP
jgi:hypothetical protein